MPNLPRPATRSSREPLEDRLLHLVALNAGDLQGLGPTGLALVATADPFGGSEELRRRAAERAGAEVAVLDGLGHWWMAEDPARGARVLTAFWRARAWSA